MNRSWLFCAAVRHAYQNCLLCSSAVRHQTPMTQSNINVVYYNSPNEKLITHIVFHYSKIWLNANGELLFQFRTANVLMSNCLNNYKTWIMSLSVSCYFTGWIFFSWHQFSLIFCRTSRRFRYRTWTKRWTNMFGLWSRSCPNNSMTAWRPSPSNSNLA